MPATHLSPAAAATLVEWHRIIDAQDFAALPSISAADVVFRSPAFFKPYPGPEAFKIVISAVSTVFEDFKYHRTFATDDGQSAVLEFSARIGDIQLKGIDMIRFDAAGKIADFEVMIRPGNALMALGKLMSERAGPSLKSML